MKSLPKKVLSWVVALFLSFSASVLVTFIVGGLLITFGLMGDDAGLGGGSELAIILELLLLLASFVTSCYLLVWRPSSKISKVTAVTGKVMWFVFLLVLVNSLAFH